MTNQMQNWAKTRYSVENDGAKPFSIVVGGRDRWALECLMAAGPQGCTPIDTPGPRWSGYVLNLRKLGVEIETVTETHGGPFSGKHGRYVLHSKVQSTLGAAA